MSYIELAHYKLLADADPNMLADAEAQIQAEVGPKHPATSDANSSVRLTGVMSCSCAGENAEAASTWNGTLFASQAGQKLGTLVDRQSMSMEMLTTVRP